MRLLGSNGDWLTLNLDGYQFPDASDPRERYSWHMVKGAARCLYGEWSFRWQALTCDSSPLISVWLRDVADWLEAAPGRDHRDPREQWRDRPEDLDFPKRLTEPNIQFRVLGESDLMAVLRVEFDCEFRPPWHLRPGRYTSDQFCLRLLVPPGDLRTAADDWDRDVTTFPDLSANM
jgi:hypothetical protein